MDIGIVFGIRHYWEIQKVVSTACAARRCSAGQALAGIAIATMSSLRHRPTTDSGTDIATLVRRALAEVCTVAVLLVYITLSRQQSQRGKKIKMDTTTAVTEKVKQTRSRTVITTLQSRWLTSDSAGGASFDLSSPGDCLRATVPPSGELAP